MKLKKLFVTFLSLLALSSCGISKTTDPNKLFIAGYPKAFEKDESGTLLNTYDYWCYLSFVTADEETPTDLSFDVSFCFDKGTAIGKTDGAGNQAKYFDVGSFKTSFPALKKYDTLQDFFTCGGYVSLFTSIDELNRSKPFVSSRVRIARASAIVAIPTVKTPNEALQPSYNTIYTYSFNIGSQTIPLGGSGNE